MTRTRGTGDTPAPPFKIRQPRPRAIFIALLIAALLHVPFVPSRLLAWIQLYALFHSGDERGDDEGEVIIPIDLDLLGPSAPTTESPPPAPEPPAAADTDGTPVVAPTSEPKATPPKKKEETALDGGVDAAIDAPDDAPSDAPDDAPSDAPPDAANDDAGAIAKLGSPDASDGLLPITVPADAGSAPEPADAGPEDAGLDAGPPAIASADAGAPQVKDPLAKAGGPARLAKKPNVQILIAGDRIRKHELGAGFSRILKSLYQWGDFFKGTNVDPIKDLDHLLLAGPQFKVDSSRVVAVMDFNRSEKDIRGAVDAIVKNSNGEWLKDAPIPTAKAKADNAERLFALVPGKRLLVILPVTEKDQLGTLKSLQPFKKSSQVGISVALVTPSRPFKGLINLPDSLKEMRLDVTPTSDGGADILLELDDASPDDATKHAAELTSAFDLFRMANQVKIPFTSITIDVIDKTTFFADGTVIRASAHMSVRQLRGIMGFAEQALADQRKKLEGAKAPRR